MEEVFKIINKMKEDLGKIQELLVDIDKTIVDRKAKSVVPEEFFTTHQASVNQIFSKNKNQRERHFQDHQGDQRPGQNRQKVQGLADDPGVHQRLYRRRHRQGHRHLPEDFERFHRPRPLNNCSYIPWFEVSLTLVKSRVCFSTEFSDSVGGASIRGILSNVIKDILDIAISIQRADSGGVGDYLVEIKDNFDLRMLLFRINSNLDLSERDCNSYKESFKDFQQYLAQDSKTYFENFLRNEREVKTKNEQASGQSARRRMKTPSTKTSPKTPF